ncbi:MAG: hypothetical protein EOO51_15190, partial [Flavobacterium sp.]
MIRNYANKILKATGFIILVLMCSQGFAQNSAELRLAPLAPAPPTVVSPVSYCQNAPTWPLSVAVTVTPGCTLNWYGTNATGGTATATPSVVDTSALGTFTYYVSQSNASGESPRAPISVKVVTVVATGLFCDGGGSTNTTVAFDWSNITGYGLYHYTYSINGGPPVSGSQLSPSHFNVPVTGPNIPVTFTITAVDNFPCYQPETRTCAKCTTTVTPTFGTIQSTFCQGSAAASPLPTTSTNGISGTWAPAFSTANVGTVLYTFTPTAAPCANAVQVNITTIAPVTPTFNAIAPFCSGTAAPTLPTTSTNGISGTWSPSTVSNTT